MNLLGGDYQEGLAQVAAFRRSGATYQPRTAVWEVAKQTGENASITLGTVAGGAAELRHARAVIVATGAMERPLPLPGWTLPGVMGAGAAQTLLKGSAMIPNTPSILVGSGPLLYLVAWQLLRAGAPPRALWLTTPHSQWRHALPALPGMLRVGGELWKGLRWLRELRAAGVTISSGAEDLRIEGADRVEAVSARFGDRTERIEIGLALLHHGIVPNAQLTMAAGCEHAWDPRQRCWRPRADEWGASSVSGILTAGDGAGIGAALRRELGARPFLDRLFPPAAMNGGDDLTVCPCEGVSARELRAVIELGCPGPNQAKAFTRCGMGPCQGRMCGITVSETFARERDVQVDSIGHYRLRPPVKPLTVGELGGVADPPGESGGLPTKAHK